MMTVLPYKADHLLTLSLQPGQEYCRAFVTPDYAKMLEDQWAFTALLDGKVIAVGGVAKLWENRGLAWAFIDRNAGAHFPQLHRIVKDVLAIVPYGRIEAETPCDFAQGHRWLKLLGFQMEAARMRAHRPDGGDSSLYARVK